MSALFPRPGAPQGRRSSCVSTSPLHLSDEIFNTVARIRPLQTDDLRIRTLSGRHQITTDGRHLYDGIPFGRPYLKRPARPEVLIPGRRAILPITANNDENNVADLQANRSETELVDSQQGLRRIAFREGARDDNQLSLTDGLTRRHQVHFSDENPDQEQASVEPALDDEESDDYMPPAIDSDDEGDETEDSDDLDSDSDVSFDSSDDDASTESSESGRGQVANVDGATLGADDSAYSSQSIDSTTAEKPQNRNPPGQGTRSTKHRNKRRKLLPQLKHYKRRGDLPPEANFKDLERVLQSITRGSLHSDESQHAPEPRGDDITHTTDVSRVERPDFLPAAPTSLSPSASHRTLSGSVDKPNSNVETNSIQEYCALAKDNAHSDLSTFPSLTSGQSNKPLSYPAEPEIDAIQYEDEVTKDNIHPNRNAIDLLMAEHFNMPSGRTTKVDVPAMNRLVRAGLGLRNPDQDAKKEKKAATARSGSPAASVSGEKSATSPQQRQAPKEQTLGPDDPNFWCSRINLRARECERSDRGPRIPPFPYQHPRRLSRTRLRHSGSTDKMRLHYDDPIDYEAMADFGKHDNEVNKVQYANRKRAPPAELDEKASKKSKSSEEE